MHEDMLYVCPTIGCECEGRGLPEDEGQGLFCSLCLRDLVPMVNHGEAIATNQTGERPRLALTYIPHTEIDDLMEAYVAAQK